jgi:HemY protein
MMAELERAERNDEGRAREWMARALHAAPDPQWTADGYVSDRWLPVSPVTGRLDAFEWRVPLTGMVAVPGIETEPDPLPVAQIEAAPQPQEPPPVVAAPIDAQVAQPDPPPPSPPGGEAAAPPAAVAPGSVAPGSPGVQSASRRRAKTTPAKAEPVIPLVHAPDDPGPEAAEDNDPPPPEPQTGGWRKIFE